MSTSTPSFLVGTAISVYQNSGGTDSNWSEFELKRTGNGKPTIKGGVTCGNGANFWELYEEDIERAASLKLNSFRLSIEWNRIEPKRGELDEAGIARYHQIFDCLHRCYLHAITITPTACSPPKLVKANTQAARFKLSPFLARWKLADTNWFCASYQAGTLKQCITN